MPQRTKIALICILGLGIMASIAALARMLFYKFWDKEAHPEGYLCKQHPFFRNHSP